jgi:hypothetical protein
MDATFLVLLGKQQNPIQEAIISPHCQTMLQATDALNPRIESFS